MHRKLLRVVVGLAAVFFCASAQQFQNKPDELAASVARMVRIGEAVSPTFSPDGKRVAFISDLNGIPQVWIIPSQGGYPQLVTFGDNPVTHDQIPPWGGGVRWSPTDNDLLAFSLAPGGGMNTQICVVHSDGTGLHRLTAVGKQANRFYNWTHDGRFLLASSNARDPVAIDPYLVDVGTGELDLLHDGEGFESPEDVSRDGHYALISQMAQRGNNNLYLLDLKTHRETFLTPHGGPGEFHGQFAPDARTIYLRANKDRDLAAFARVRIGENNSAGPIEFVATRNDAELDTFMLNDQGTLAALVWNVRGESQLELIELPSARITHAPKIPGEVAGGLAFSRDGKRLAMTLQGPRAPSDVWVMDIATNELRQLTFSSHAGVALTQLVRPELVKFRAFDGLELSGWLYRPNEPAQTEKPQPYVISFHGGPEAEELPVLHSDYQALLSQGIGVFAPNVRGSSGFGKRFVNLDNGGLRANAVKDVKSCADYLVANGLADPTRIGITGGSYGGYLTLAGVTEFPDAFVAGVDLYGIVDWSTYFQQTAPWMAKISTLEHGDPVKDTEMLKSLSPIYKLDRIKAAMMVQHGANDTNVPVIEAEQIVTTLKARGVPVEYVFFPDEGHVFVKTANRIKSTVSMVEFFVNHLQPVVPATTE